MFGILQNTNTPAIEIGPLWFHSWHHSNGLMNGWWGVRSASETISTIVEFLTVQSSDNGQDDLHLRSTHPVNQPMYPKLSKPKHVDRKSSPECQVSPAGRKDDVGAVELTVVKEPQLYGRLRWIAVVDSKNPFIRHVVVMYASTICPAYGFGRVRWEQVGVERSIWRSCTR